MREIVPSCLTRLYDAAPVVPELWEEIFPILPSGWVADPIPNFETYMRNFGSFPVLVITVLSNDEIRRAQDQVMATHDYPVAPNFLQTMKPDTIIGEIAETGYGPFHSRTGRHLGVPDNSYLFASSRT